MYPDSNSSSQKIYDRALSSLPGGNTRTTVFMKPYPIYAARGEGCRVWDVDGNAFIDCINNFTSQIHGHAHPALVKAQIELNQGNPGKAIDLLDSALVYARANSGVLYIRGNAYLKAGRGSDAVQAFQRLLDLKNMIIIDPTMPLAKVGLARAYVLAGDKARARVAYQDFFAVWKDADPDIPIVRDVKAEYAKLQ